MKNFISLGIAAATFSGLAPAFALDLGKPVVCQGTYFGNPIVLSFVPSYSSTMGDISDQFAYAIGFKNQAIATLYTYAYSAIQSEKSRHRSDAVDLSMVVPASLPQVLTVARSGNGPFVQLEWKTQLISGVGFPMSKDVQVAVQINESDLTGLLTVHDANGFLNQEIGCATREFLVD